VVQRSVAYGQRLWKAQPDGGFSGFGSSPTILIFGLFGSGWMVGVAVHKSLEQRGQAIHGVVPAPGTGAGG
jgi:hypothetical protein